MFLYQVLRQHSDLESEVPAAEMVLSAPAEVEKAETTEDSTPNTVCLEVRVLKVFCHQSGMAHLNKRRRADLENNPMKWQFVTVPSRRERSMPRSYEREPRISKTK